MKKTKKLINEVITDLRNKTTEVVQRKMQYDKDNVHYCITETEFVMGDKVLLFIYGDRDERFMIPSKKITLDELADLLVIIELLNGLKD